MPPRKSRKDKTPSPETSPEESSTPSVVDDTANLIKGARGTSSDARGSKSPNRTKGGQKTSPTRIPESNLGATSGDASEAGTTSDKNRLIPPKETGTSKGQRKLSPKGLKYKHGFEHQNRSPNTPSSSPSKKSTQSKCPELEKLAAAKAKENLASKSSSDSKPSSCNESPVISKKKTDGPQSSSSTDQSSENLKTPKSRLPGTSRLSVPARASPHKSPSKDNPKSPSKSLGARVKDIVENVVSDGECNCEVKCENLLACPTRRKSKTVTKTKLPAKSSTKNQIKSEGSSSSSSPGTSRLSVPARASPHKSPSKDNPKSPSKGFRARVKGIFTKAKSPNKDQIKYEGSSSSSSSPGISKKSKYVDEGNISSKSSKSSSFAEPTAEESSSSIEGNGSLACSSDNKSPKKPEDDTASGNQPDFDPQEGTSSSPARVGRNKKTFEQLLKPVSPFARQRTKSLPKAHRRSSPEYDRYPSPSNHRIMQELRKPLNANIERISRTEDSSETERLLRRTEKAKPDASIRRYQSQSPTRPRPCNCGQAARGTDHRVGCALMIDLRARRKGRRCRQEVGISRNSLKEEDAVLLGSKGRYERRPKSEGQNADSQDDKKSDSEDEEKSS